MSDSEFLKQKHLEGVQSFVAELGDYYEWHWDEQLECILCEFSVDHEQNVFLVAKKNFPFHWDKKSIKNASPFLRHRAGMFGVLSKDQKLLTQDTDGREEMMLAWWPWGHGATISIRIFRANSSPYVEPTGILHSLKRLLRIG